MGATRTDLYQDLLEIQNLLIRFRAKLADLEITEGDDDTRPRTGWRFVRGSHSGNYVRDPQGTDRPPAGYGA